MLQGFGLAFLIVPITQVAYSYLPLNKRGCSGRGDVYQEFQTTAETD
jgi:hypothetical protein